MSTVFEFDFGADTHPGLERPFNEDNYLVDKKLRLFIVADGMGGHAAGEVASAICVRKTHESLCENRDIIESFVAAPGHVEREEVLHVLEHAVQVACSAIYERGQKEPEKRGMGTTCSVLLLAGERGFIAHVGDSRIYLIRNGQVHQLSEDHSLVNALKRHGKITMEQIENSPYSKYKDAVTRAVGVYESVEVDTFDLDVLPGDQFLLCSDGLHYYLEPETILETVKLETAKHISKAFVDIANIGGGHDNITSVFIRVLPTHELDLRSQELSLKLEVLKGISIFRHLSYKELVRVLNITKERTLVAGESIFSEGTKGDELYIILEGRIQLHKGDTFVASLSRGDHFGEMALVDLAPRSTGAYSEAATTRLLTIHRRDFFDILRQDSKLGVKLLMSFVLVLSDRLRKTTADLSGARFEMTLPDLTEEALFEEDRF